MKRQLERGDGVISAGSGSSVAAGAADLAAISLLAARWLELDTKARLIVTLQLRLLWTNPAASRILASGELEVRDGTLCAWDGAAQDRLARFVADCGAGVKTLPVRSRDGESHLLLRGHRLESAGGHACIGIQLVHTETEMRKPIAEIYVGVDEAFGLTCAEYRVLGALVDGRTAEETARLHGVSIDTVRSQIRHIYEKMSVSSRESLFRRMGAFVI